MVAGIFTEIEADTLANGQVELSGRAKTQLETVLRTGGSHQNSSGKSAGDEDPRAIPTQLAQVQFSYRLADVIGSKQHPP